MPSINKKVLYGEERRKNNRIEQDRQIKIDAEHELAQYLAELNLDMTTQAVDKYYPSIYDFINRKSSNFSWKKYAHQYFRSFIQNFNSKRGTSYPLPYLPLVMKRDPLVRNSDWFQHGHTIDLIIEKLQDYWILAKDSHSFSDNEVVGNILLSAILFAGLSDLSSLTALLEHLKNPAKIRTIETLNIIFLEPSSPNYGDVYIVEEKKIRKSRNFIPDQITRLWLIHFNARKIQIHDTHMVSDFLSVIFNKIQMPFNKKIFKTLREYANFNWTQLPNADIDPAIAQCLSEEILTCGLSEQEFENFYQPKFKNITDHTEKLTSHIKSETLISYTQDTHHALDNIVTIHKDILHLIRTASQKEDPHLAIIQYMITNINLFNLFSQRIILWLISLYRPDVEHIRPLLDLLQINPIKFQTLIQNYNALADSSIYTYYTRIAEPWLTHSLQYLDADENINDLLNKIYEQILTNSQLVDPTVQQKVKKSKDQTVILLKRFHSFQKHIFGAQDFEVEAIVTQSRPRARIISPLTFNMLIQKLEFQYSHKLINEHSYTVLKLIYILAIRTGMRINEILNLRINDIEGTHHLSLWVRPYGSKKQNNLHQLKTDSAERVVPVYCLLKSHEYEIFHQFVVNRRLLSKEKLYLFSEWNENTKFNKNFVTTPLRIFFNEIFQQHDYSFHSFRHTSANNLALILNAEYEPLVKILTDYSFEEYSYIRTELLRNAQGQNHWFVLAHLLGHIDPGETFKSYIHLSYLIGGYQLSKHYPQFTIELVQKMMGYSNQHTSFLLINSSKKDALFKFSQYSDQLSQLLLHPQKTWSSHNTDEVQTYKIDTFVQPHNFFDYFAGTIQSKISFNLFYQCLTLLESEQSPLSAASQLSLPFDLVQYWYENAIQLKTLKSRKGKLRLFTDEKINNIKPSMVDTAQEKQITQFFFNQLQIQYQNHPEHLLNAFNVFLERVTSTHTGIHFTRKQIDQLESFYSHIKTLFPQKYWLLSGAGLEQNINQKQHPNLFKLLQSQEKFISEKTDNNIRLQLYSSKYQRALGVFKFCMHLACIGKPNSIKASTH